MSLIQWSARRARRATYTFGLLLRCSMHIPRRNIAIAVFQSFKKHWVAFHDSMTKSSASCVKATEISIPHGSTNERRYVSSSCPRHIPIIYRRDPSKKLPFLSFLFLSQTITSNLTTSAQAKEPIQLSLSLCQTITSSPPSPHHPSPSGPPHIPNSSSHPAPSIPSPCDSSGSPCSAPCTRAS